MHCFRIEQVYGARLDALGVSLGRGAFGVPEHEGGPGGLPAESASWAGGRGLARRLPVRDMEGLGRCKGASSGGLERSFSGEQLIHVVLFERGPAVTGKGSTKL